LFIQGNRRHFSNLTFEQSDYRREPHEDTAASPQRSA
jgi:hypothetical protein